MEHEIGQGAARNPHFGQKYQHDQKERVGTKEALTTTGPISLLIYLAWKHRMPIIFENANHVMIRFTTGDYVIRWHLSCLTPRG